MSKLAKGVKKVFKKVGQAIKKVTKSKVFKAILIAAAILYTGGMAAGYFGAAGTAGSVASAVSSIPIVGEAAAGLITAGTTAGGALAAGGITALGEVVGSQLGLTTLSPETALMAEQAAGGLTAAPTAFVAAPAADGAVAATGALEGAVGAGAGVGTGGASSASALPDAFGNMPGAAGFDATTAGAAPASSGAAAAAPASSTVASAPPISAETALEAASNAGQLSTTQGPLISGTPSSSGSGIIARAMDWYSNLKPAGQMVVGQAVSQAGTAALNAYASRSAQEEARRVEEERRARNRVTDLPVLNFGSAGAPRGGSSGIITDAMRRGGA